VRAEPVRVAGVAVFAPLAYEGPARELVRALKYRGARSLAGTMASQIAANAPTDLHEEDALVPVPLHRTRERRRGFNQAALLAAALADRTGLPVVDCLERRGRGAAQVGRGRAQRLAEPRGGVRTRAGVLVPARALLVDDVVTTGATLAACARALQVAGCGEVRAVAYARTLAR
jgi:ComF family protein